MAEPRVTTWVVYRTPIKGTADERMAVCGAVEWAAMTAARPDLYTLVREGIPSEGEAERLARGTSGDTVRRSG